MKKIYYLLITLAISSLSFGQVEVFNLAGGGAFPDGWTATNNVTTYDIDRGSYFLLDSGDPSDIIVSSVYDLSAYSSAVFNLDLATFGSGDNNSATIEISYDGGATYTQTETSAVPTSSSYIDGGSFAVTPSAQVVIKFTNSGVAGKGNRLRNLILTGAAPICTSSEGFETFPLVDWTLNSSNTSNSVTQSVSWANSGTNSLRFSSYNSASTYDQYAVTPQLVTTSGDQTISFYYKSASSNGTELFKVGTSSTGDDLANDFTWSDEIVSSTTAAQYSITDLPVGTTYVAIHYYSNYQYYMYVDDFCMPELYVPDCVAPTNLSVSGVTTTGAVVSWVSDGTQFMIELQPAG